LVYRPHSQIPMGIMSLSLFHNFVKKRFCGRQRTPGVVFWLKLDSVLGFKFSYSVDTPASPMYVVGKSKRAFFACRHRSYIFVSIEWKFTRNSVRGSTAVDFAVQSTV